MNHSQNKCPITCLYRRNQRLIPLIQQQLLLLLLLLLLLPPTTSAFQILPHLRFNPNIARLVGPEESWNNRATGILPYWTSGLGFWQHYDVTTITSDSFSTSSPFPYTQGYMRKHLRLVNETAFELWSVYQPEARGGWLAGLMSHNRMDGNWHHSYLFQYRPYRINPNPLPNLPDGSTTRVFLVGEDATLHGTMHLPTISELESHHGPHWQFFELWLSEEYRGEPQGRKVGAVVEFHGLSGCLNQLFCIHEIAEDEVHHVNPNDDIDFYGNEEALAGLFPRQTTVPDNFYATTSAGQTWGSHEQQQPWAHTHVVHLPNHMEPEYESIVEGPLQETALDPNLFHTIALDNGAYLKIPKCFDASLNGTVCIEFGCRRLDGSCHRLVVYGDRQQGCYHTIAYDRWRDD